MSNKSGEHVAGGRLVQESLTTIFLKTVSSEFSFTVPADSRLEIVVENSVPPTTSSGSEATTASPAASPSGTDLHTDMSNFPGAGRRRSTRKRRQTAYVDALDRGDGTVDGWGRKAYPTGLQCTRSGPKKVFGKRRPEAGSFRVSLEECQEESQPIQNSGIPVVAEKNHVKCEFMNSGMKEGKIGGYMIPGAEEGSGIYQQESLQN
ncbi:hypothetical protein B0H14DRAFT_2601610 [Mycena olivaceomarginata]|nr:hypothetical protein B0H14DRAFT_2601610 [Mycena olivaceomarginata]